MSRLINRSFPKFLSFLLIMAMLYTPATCFAAAADQQLDVNEVVENSDSVQIYNVNDGNSFYEIAQNIRARDYESIIGFDVNGNKLFDCTSYLPSKSYTTAAIRRNFTLDYGTTIIHNHPSGSAFSAQDIYTEARYQTPRIIAIGNQYTYVFEPTTTGWGDPDAMKQFYEWRYNAYYDEATETVKNFTYDRKTILNLADTPDDGSCHWFCVQITKSILRANPNASVSFPIGIWITHRTMQDVAQQFNMLYYRVATDSFDFTDNTIFYSEAVARRQHQDYYNW